MRFVALFAVGAAASLIPRAEVDLLKDGIKNLKEQVKDLTEAVSGYNKNMDRIRYDAKNILLAVNALAADTKGMKGPLSDPDASNLAIPIQDLRQGLEKCMSALHDKKAAFKADCHGPEIYQFLVDHQAQAWSFQSAFVNKLSQRSADLAKQIAKPINATLLTGVNDYSDQANVKCPGSPKSAPKNPDAPAKNPSKSPLPSTNENTQVSNGGSASSGNSGTPSESATSGAPTLITSDSSSSGSTSSGSSSSGSSSPATNGTITSPNAPIQTGSASNIAASLGFTVLAAMALFTL